MPDKYPITSFGPAITRRTRTPINFSSLPQDQSGNYEGPALIPQLLNLLPRLPQTKGSITVDPSSSDYSDLSNTTRHEEIHSLLQNLAFSGTLKTLSNSNPIYKVIASKLTGRGGDPVVEAPAYMGAFNNEQVPDVMPSERTSYVDHLIKQLEKIDPKTASTYKSLAGVQ